MRAGRDSDEALLRYPRAHHRPDLSRRSKPAWENSACPCAGPPFDHAPAERRIEETLSRREYPDALGRRRCAWLGIQNMGHLQAMERGRRAGVEGREGVLRGLYKEIAVVAEEGSEDDNGTRLFARATPVFAAEQVNG